jgi:CDP-diacylglycerol--serine O-phosphatidyltransferase
MVLLFYRFGWPVSFKKLAILLLIYLLAFLMVSNFRYYSFKDPSFIKRQPFIFLVLAILLLIVIAAEPVLMLFILFICYIFSGPIEYIMTYPRRRRLKKVMHKGHS